jgi:hypothetical protein
VAIERNNEEIYYGVSRVFKKGGEQHKCKQLIYKQKINCFEWLKLLTIRLNQKGGYHEST